jgi:FkbM family methyltransferase
MHNSLLKIGNLLFKHLYPIYLPLYSLYKQISETKEREFIKKHVAPGSTVIDIGANIGVFTKFLSEVVGEGGEVHAFEPSPENFLLLKKNTRSLKNVFINQKAIGDVNGRLKLYISDELYVDHRTYPVGDYRDAIEVACIRLDDYFENNKKIEFIKMDIQGFEYRAFGGMQEIIIRNNHIKILFEFWPYGLRAAGSDPKKLIELLKEAGFELYVISRSGWKIISEKLIEEETAFFNVLAFRQNFIT